MVSLVMQEKALGLSNLKIQLYS